MDAGKVWSSASLELVVDEEIDELPVPVTTTAIEVERAPLYRGYPTVPRVWADMAGMVSLTGRTASSARPTPAEVPLTSETRFVAGHGWADGLWRPLAGAGALRSTLGPQTLTFTTPTGQVLSRAFHRITDDALGLDLGDGRLAPASFTVTAVVSILPTETPQQVLGHWDFGRDTFLDDGLGLRWVAGEKWDYHFGGMGGSVDPIRSLTSLRPLIVTSVVAGDEVRMFVSPTDKECAVTTIRGKQAVVPYLRYQLGGDGCDFRLFEFNLWSYALDEAQVRQTHANLFGAYGSEWA